MIDSKPAKTSIRTHHGFQMIEGEKLANRGHYQRMVGKLIYLAHTRPDTAYAIGAVSKFINHKHNI